MVQSSRKSDSDARGSVKLTVVFDNYEFARELQTSWGFACLVETDDVTLLFDTGGDGDILLHNMNALNIDPGDIDKLVISHDHWDHTGGLGELMPRLASPEIFLLESFSADVKKVASGGSASVRLVTGSMEIAGSILSTGEMGSDIKEQSLIIRTTNGAILVTGCAHPGIVPIVERAIELTGDDILFVVGGFHLLQTAEDKLTTIVSRLQELGVRCVAPSHCSGDAARHMFAEAYGDYFIEVGAGKVITLEDLASVIKR